MHYFISALEFGCDVPATRNSCTDFHKVMKLYVEMNSLVLQVTVSQGVWLEQQNEISIAPKHKPLIC